MAALEDALRNRWKDFEVEYGDKATFMRLLERLPDTARYSIDAYGVYRCLPVNKHRVGKGGAVNRTEELHSALRGRLNRLGYIRRRSSSRHHRPAASSSGLP